jgi:hypothetical protein
MDVPPAECRRPAYIWVQFIKNKVDKKMLRALGVEKKLDKWVAGHHALAGNLSQSWRPAHLPAQPTRGQGYQFYSDN